MVAQTGESHWQPPNTPFHIGINGLARVYAHDERESAGHGAAPGFNPQRVAHRLTVNEPPGVGAGCQRFPERLIRGCYESFCKLLTGSQ